MDLSRLATLGYEFSPPASDYELGELAALLGYELPAPLAAALRASNGYRHTPCAQFVVFDSRGMGVANASIRRDYTSTGRHMPLDHLLFIGSGGCDGNLFALGRGAGGQWRNDVYAWDPSEDSRPWKAPSIPALLEWWATSKISI